MKQCPLFCGFFFVVSFFCLVGFLLFVCATAVSEIFYMMIRQVFCSEMKRKLGLRT